MSKSNPPSTSSSRSTAVTKSENSSPIRADPSAPSSSSYPPPSSPEAIESFAQYAQLKHYGSLTFFFLAPVLLALPPRKIDFYSFGLAGAWTFSASQLVRERNEGRGIIESLALGKKRRGGEGKGVDEAQATSKQNVPPTEAERMKEPFTKIRKEGESPKEGAKMGDDNAVQEAVEEDHWEYIKSQIKEVWRVDDTGEKKPKG